MLIAAATAAICIPVHRQTSQSARHARCNPRLLRSPERNIKELNVAKSKSAQMDAIELLTQDHRKVDQLFKQFEKVKDDEDAAAELIEAACMELQIHDTIETEIFYPGVREQAEEDELEDLLNEAEVEHDTVRELIDKLEGIDDDMEKQHAHFKVLMEYVKHHVKEEEEEMFPQLKELENLDLQALGAEMSKRKSELQAELGAEAAT